MTGGETWPLKTRDSYPEGFVVDICPMRFLCGWLVGVEFAAGLPERPSSRQRHFLQGLEGVAVRGVLIHTAPLRRCTLQICVLLAYLLMWPNQE